MTWVLALLPRIGRFLGRNWKLFAILAALAGVYIFVRIVANRAYDRGVADTKAMYQQVYDTALQTNLATQREVYREAFRIGIEELAGQRVILNNTNTIVREITTRVTQQADAACPVPLGFVRVFDAAASGSPAAGFAHRAPEPDDAATDVVLSEIAAVSAGDLGACHANAEQLRQLQAVVRTFQQRIGGQ